MTQFRVSKHLIRTGVSEAEQHIIFGQCTKRKTDEERDQIFAVCEEVAGMYASALFEFVTNPHVNHNYIYLHYSVPQQRLFMYKYRFYIKFKELFL